MKKIIAGCLLLLALDASADQSQHCLWGCPTGLNNGSFFDRPAYALKNNRWTKFADWLAYQVTPSTIASGCSRNFRADPNIASRYTLEPNDYNGANATIGTDRGHQAPLASLCGTGFGSTTNYLSNITPQKSELNQGPWNRLEAEVRDAANRFGEAYVYTGPLYESVTEQLPNANERHTIPSGYWKVIVSFDGNTARSAAFIMPQEAGRNDNICFYETTIDAVESRAGLNFFPQLSSSQQQIIESGFGSLGNVICP